MMSRWCDLPDLLLEEIFAYLNIKERYYASLTCINWHRAFYLKRVWSNFVVEDDTLCQRKFNYYSGYQYVLDHMRTQQCLTRIGRNLKGLNFQPLHNFNNMYQFMEVLIFNIRKSRDSDCDITYNDVGKFITSFKYIFPCNMSSKKNDDVQLFGTGGQLLKASILRLVTNQRDFDDFSYIDPEGIAVRAEQFEISEACRLDVRTLRCKTFTRRGP